MIMRLFRVIPLFISVTYPIDDMSFRQTIRNHNYAEMRLKISFNIRYSRALISLKRKQVDSMHLNEVKAVKEKFENEKLFHQQFFGFNNSIERRTTIFNTIYSEFTKIKTVNVIEYSLFTLLKIPDKVLKIRPLKGYKTNEVLLDFENRKRDHPEQFSLKPDFLFDL